MSESSPTRYRLMPPGNPFAMWALVCGVAGFCVPAVGGLAAIVLGVLGLIRANKTLEGKGPSIAGIALGVVSLVTSSLATWGIVNCMRVVNTAH